MAFLLRLDEGEVSPISAVTDVGAGLDAGGLLKLSREDI